MSKPYVVLSIILFLLCWMDLRNSVHAQEACDLTLSGWIFDEHDNQPLPYSEVYIVEAAKGGVCDTTGRYSISGLCPGTYTIRCTHVGCEPIVIRLNLIKDKNYNFYPEHHAELLLEISVVGETKKETSTLIENSISKEELDETRGQSLGQSLKNITGVTTLSTGNSISKPVIHGLHSNRVLILNNGVRQEGQQWGSEHAPEIDPFIANKLTVVKGANSVRYGSDAIAGVILVDPAPLRDSIGIGGEVNLVGFSNGQQGVASGMIEGNFRKLKSFQWRAQGSLKKSGNVHSPNYYLKNTGLQEQNFSLATAYQKDDYGIGIFYSQFNTDVAILSASHIGNLSDLQRAFEADEPLEKSGFTYEINRPWQHIEHELTKVDGRIRTGNHGKLKFVYARQYNLREEYDKHQPLNDSLAGLNKPALHFEITTHTGDLIWEHYKIGPFKGQLGISGISQSNTFQGRYFIPNFKNEGGGIFLIERWKRKLIELEAGIRYDHRFLKIYKYENNELISPEFTYQNFSWSLGGIFKPSKKLSYRLNIGSAWRPPNASELFSDGLHHGAATVEIGDRSLVPEKSYQLTGSIDYVSRSFRIEASSYYNYIQNFIYLAPVFPATLTIRGAFPTYQYQQVEAALLGVDVTSDLDFTSRINLGGKITFLNAYNRTANEYLVQMPANRFEVSLKYKFRSTKRFKDNYISGSVLHVMKQTNVPDSSDYVAPPNAYSLVSLNASTTLIVGKQILIIGLGVENLLNTTYRDYMNRFRYFTDDLGRNFSVRIKIPFNYEKQEPLSSRN